MQLPEFITRTPDGMVLLTGHRIAIDDLAYHYNEGYTAEMLALHYPTLPLSLIHKAIAFYLDNREAIDQHISEGERAAAQYRQAGRKPPAIEELRRRMDARRILWFHDRFSTALLK